MTSPTPADPPRADLSGMAVDDLLAGTALHRELGLRIEETPDGVRLAGTIGPRWARADTLPFVHGGAIATILDVATTFALLATTRHLWSTVGLQVDYLRPVPLGTVEVSATVVRAGSAVGWARAELRDAAGGTCACSTGTFVRDRARARS